MALWDSADLLKKAKFHSGAPDADMEMTDLEWYDLLTEGEAHVKPLLSTQIPWTMWTDAVLLTTSDSIKYSFPSGVTFPLAVEVRERLNARLMIPMTEGTENGDFLIDKDGIRMPGNRPRTFSDGPYARFITQPGTVDASTDSTIFPDFARILVVWMALETWAGRGGLRSPNYFRSRYQRALEGDPDTDSDGGILFTVKNQYQQMGSGLVFPIGSAAWSINPGGLP